MATLNSFVAAGAVVGLVALVPSACGAGFDCAAATTNAETAICENESLSLLDDQLSHAYQYAKSHLVDKGALVNGQRAWLSQRDHCRDANCFAKAYGRRIASLESLVREAGKKPMQKYPPYPDRWDWFLRTRGGQSSKAYDVFRLTTGDYLITYLVDKSSAGQLTFDGLSIFDGAVFRDVDQSLLLGNLQHIGPGTDSIMLSSGIRLSRKNRDQSLQRCPQALNYYFRAEWPDGHAEEFVIFYLLDTPQEEEISVRCPTQARSYTKRVATLGADILPLEREGFLLIEPNMNLVLRFDESMRTGSRLLGRRVFLLSNQASCNLGICGLEDANFQRRQDDVARYLANQARGEGQ